MTETTTTPETTTPETPKTPKAKKQPKKAAKPAAPKADKPKAEKKLPKPQRQVLGQLSKAKGVLTRRMIADRVEKAGDPVVNHRIASETKTYLALLEANWIRAKELDIDGVKETAYEITAAGRKAIGK